MAPVAAGCARNPACRESGCGCGCQSPWPWIDPPNDSRRTHALQEQKTLSLCSSKPSGVLEGSGPRVYPLANVGAGAFGTWDAVHPSFPVVCWVLGVHKLLPQGPEGTEGDLDG